MWDPARPFYSLRQTNPSPSTGWSMWGRGLLMARHFWLIVHVAWFSRLAHPLSRWSQKEEPNLVPRPAPFSVARIRRSCLGTRLGSACFQLHERLRGRGSRRDRSSARAVSIRWTGLGTGLWDWTEGLDSQKVALIQFRSKQHTHYYTTEYLHHMDDELNSGQTAITRYQYR